MDFAEKGDVCAQMQFLNESSKLVTARAIAGDLEASVRERGDDMAGSVQQGGDVLFRTEAGDRDDRAVVARSVVGETSQVDAVPERLHTRRGDALLDHVASAVVRDAHEVLGEARCLTHEETLPPGDVRESAVMVRMDAPGHPRPPRGRHAVKERTIVVRVNDIDAFLTKKPGESAPQARAKAAGHVERQDAHAGRLDRVGQSTARAQDDHRPVKACPIALSCHLD